MNELYNEIDLVNESEDDQTLFFKHVVAGDDALASLDALLSKTFTIL